MRKYGVEYHQMNNQSCMAYPVHYNIQRNMSTIIEMSDMIKKVFGDADIVLWCSGSSGAMVAAIIASRLRNVTVSHVKKEKESSHSEHINIPSDLANEPHRKHIIVDDFMCSGNTLNYIYSKLIEKYPHLTVNGLVVSGRVYMNTLKFVPNTIISGNLSAPDGVEE